ncbi:MAG: response regulator transcription factor [Chloroflexi bacterium]|nr:response regulator transcription factor [Chloroflexota bacterium]
MAKVVVLGVGLEKMPGLAELSAGGYQLTLVATPQEALELLEQAQPEAALLSWNPSHREELGRLLERCLGRIQTVAVVAEKDLEDYFQGPAADDFLLAPPRPRELLARLGRLLSQRTEPEGSLLRSGDLTLDLEQYRVWVNERSVDLTYTEYELLRFLASNRRRVFSRETLLNKVWGYDYFGGSRTVDVHIRRLRAKLEDKDHIFIETVRNVGYRFQPSPPL